MNSITTPKMNVAIIISGQWRTNDTCIRNRDMSSPLPNKATLSMIEYFESNGYNVDIFISTDDLHLYDTCDKYGDRIKNIYLCDTGYLSEELAEHNLSDYKINHYLDKFHVRAENTILNDLAYTNLPVSEFSIEGYDRLLPQFLKLYLGYILMEDYAHRNKITYDIVVRTRPDATFEFAPDPAILSDIQNSKYIIAHSDIFACGSYKIMSIYCKLIESYGAHHVFSENYDIDGVFGQTIRRWAFAPETQLYSLLMETLNKPFDKIYTNFGLKNVELIR